MTTSPKVRPPAETVAPTLGFSVWYAGSRRLPNLPDGREVWQAYVGGNWKTFYEMPLFEDDRARLRDRLEKARL